PPKDRLARLQQFWERVTLPMPPLSEFGEFSHQFFNRASAMAAVLFGASGFFRPRFPFALLQPQGTPGALSFYDTDPLIATLGELIDFELINNPRAIRLSLGAVNVRSANFVYFDNSKRTLTV